MNVDASQPSSSPLLSIPLEVLLNITSRLKTPDYCNFRLTCNAIEATLFNTFAQEYFTKRQFMLTELSLQALVDISKSRFSSSLTHVIIGLERPWTTSQLRGGGGVHSSNPLANQTILRSVSYATFVNSAQDVEMLTEAFSNLNNLKTIGIRDFNSRSRGRDWPNNEWRSYGASTQPNWENVRYTPPEYLTRTFLTLLRAVGKASCKPQHFEVILRHLELYDHSFHLPSYLEPIVQPVLANLRTLLLDLSPYPTMLQVDLHGKPVAFSNYFLLQFISNCISLEHLRLNFRSYPQSTRNDILAWLSESRSNPVLPASNASTGDVLHFPPPMDFESLCQLDIGMITINSGALLAIIKKYRATLRSINLHKITLLEADDVDAEHRVSLWSKLFRQFAKLDLKLDYLSVSNATQSKMGYRHKRIVSFKQTRDPLVKIWAGTDTQSGLRDFISDIVVERLDVDTEVEVESDDSVSDDEDDEDDGSDDGGNHL